jgi:predicted aldo/keto reductase-like oxidoreductase
VNYRTFGKIPFQPSALGFGVMRLPVFHGNFKLIDEAQAISMIHHAIDHGVNYVDTAYPYHGGMSEVVLGKALSDGYRDKVKIADKMPIWLVQEPADFDRFFDEQRTRLGVDKIDFYLAHALSAKGWKRVKDLGYIEWAEKRKAAGDIDYIGFSFHDGPEAFIEIIDSYDGWDFCMIQYNYADEDEQAGRRGLKYAAEKGMGVVVMEPLRGGDLINGIPESALEPFRKLNPDRTLPEWGLRWLWNQPEVSFMISGMSTMAQVEENVRLAETVTLPYLTSEEVAAATEVKNTVNSLKPIRCTGCGYCRECPNQIPIPYLFNVYNEYQVFRNPMKARFMLGDIPNEQRPDTCLNCRVCVSHCPQNADIPMWLEKVAELYKELGIEPKA